MCGICGIALADRQASVDPARLRTMTEVMHHRGPDAGGMHVDGHVALGHRRLSIVDLAAGAQPMANEDESVWIAFNGEIYNHAELRPGLEAAGHRYRTHSDTETIVHGYEQHGETIARHLRGMFAFAIWDARDQRLLLARDHTGIKPLYYCVTASGDLIFGSEIKCLAASGLCSIELDHEVVEEYLTTGHVAGERTLFRGIRKLQPGTILSWKNGVVRIASYWSVADVVRSHTPDESGHDDFWPRFRDSVASQLMSDVPLGVFLSGGLDSSLIVAAMREIGVADIQSFSVGYAEQEASELPWARLVSERLGTKHHEVLVDGADFFEDLPPLTWQRDLPLTFSASIPLYHVSKLARERVKVVLTGEGSDELFAGYGRYPRALANYRGARQLDRVLPGAVRNGLAVLAAQGGDRRWGNRLGRSFLAKRGTMQAACLEPFAEFSGAHTAKVLRPEVRGAPFGELSRWLDERLFDRNPLEALLRYDQATYMEELLMKQDAMSMATSIESRVPFLDHLLVEWAAQLSPDRKLRGTTGKAVVRTAAAARLPAEVVEGPKRGFLVPLARWFRTIGGESLERYAPDARDPVLSRSGYDALVQGHLRGIDHTGRLWRLLALQVWRLDTLPRLRQLATTGVHSSEVPA